MNETKIVPAKAQQRGCRGKGVGCSEKHFAYLHPTPYTLHPFLFALLLISLASCSPQQKQVGIPPAAQATIDVVTADIAAGQDEKIYKEAAEEWRRASTLDVTREFFKTLRTKLGNVKTRAYHTARGEQTMDGQSLNVQYQTTFERAEGMETFTLVERDGRWLLARYFVNSAALK
jgi:hypothetical protein